MKKISNTIIRLFLLPVGIFYKLYDLALEGSRDIYNKHRFKFSKIDRNCIISSSSLINKNCHLLENVVFINSKVSSYTYIGKRSVIQNATIGSFCSIANDVMIGLGKHPIDHFSTATIFYKVKNTLNIQLVKEDLNFDEYQAVDVGNDVWIGARAIILDGIKVGHGSVVAANSVVTKDVPPYAIVGGIPAKIIKYRFSEMKIEKLLNIKWWEWDLSKIIKYREELMNL